MQMPIILRHTLGLAIAGLILAAPLPTPATVTFDGNGLNLGLSCASTPSVTSLAIPSGGTVTFANRTGKTATLWVGDGSRSLPDGGQVPVTFGRGPTTVLVRMLPDCKLDRGNHVSMTITVGAPVDVAPSPTSSTGPSPSVKPRPSKSPAPTPTSQLGSPLTLSSIAAVPVFGAVTRNDPNTASGLLVLIATVGVLGVIVAALRVFGARRGSGAGRRG